MLGGAKVKLLFLSKKRKGSALIIVLIVFLVLSILGVSVLSISLSENKQVIAQELKMKGYYAARAGADAMASYLIKNPNELDPIIQKTRSGPAIGIIDGRKFEVYVTGTEHEFIIESISYNLDDMELSKVYLTMREVNLLNSAVFADEVLIVGNNTTINGNIATNSLKINFGSKDINGNITIGAGATPSDIEAAKSGIAPGYLVDSLSVPMILPDIDPLDFPVSIPNNSKEIDTKDYASVMSDGKLRATINAIDLSKGSDNFVVKGGGQVHLYVTGKIAASGNSTISAEAGTDLFIYSNSTDVIEFKGTPTESNITIYAPDSTILMKGGGSNENIKGSFICKKFEGPSSNVIISQGTGNMEDLNLQGVAGYSRSVWSD